MGTRVLFVLPGRRQRWLQCGSRQLPVPPCTWEEERKECGRRLHTASDALHVRQMAWAW